MLNRNCDWEGVLQTSARSYMCGHAACGREVSSERGWQHRDPDYNRPDGWIYVCPSCRRPTFFDEKENKQIPGTSIVGVLSGLPSDIQSLWTEVDGCMSQGAYTSAVLSGRKMLMHIAVDQGAEEGLNFIGYVNHLVAKNFAPPNSEAWIDRVRQHGNEANHKIVIKTADDAKEIVTFLEMLLKFIYEFPAKAKVSNK